MEALNLDGMSISELEAIFESPRLTDEQNCYVALRINAYHARLAGNIADAIKSETAMEAIYRKLPKALRW